MKIYRAIWASIAATVSFLSLGCSVSAPTPAAVEATLSISQILPQIIPVGSSGLTISVKGSNFTGQTVILWNGIQLATSLVDASTLTAPLTSGSFAVPSTAHVQVANSQTGQQSSAMNVIIASSGTTAASLAISTTSVPSGVSGTPYSASLAATGGTPSNTWSISSGALPAGMSLAASTGVISGTPAASGTFSFSVTVSDSGSPQQTATAALALSVAASTPVPTTLVLGSTTLPGGTAAQSYGGSLSATAGTAPYVWSIPSGQLPSGISLAPSTGVISGTPTASGTSSFTVRVTDSGSPAQTASGATSIVVLPALLSITSSALASGTSGTAYSQTLLAGGGTPGYTWSISSGSLPAGLALVPATGVISGTPTTNGTSSFTVSVIDSGTPTQIKSSPTSIVIGANAMAITSSTLASGTKGTAYSQSLQASGGTPGYTWSITSGSLPTGLTLAASTGVISGTPTASGTSSFTATVTDSGSPAQIKSAATSIVVGGTTLAITTSTLPSGTKSSAYSQTLTASGGTPGYTWSLTVGSLPAGLTLAPSTGVISGTPTATGTSSFTATVTDGGSPAQSKSVATSIVVGAIALGVSTSTLSSGANGTAYSQTLVASGGTPAYTWSITTGSLPAGLTLVPSTGVISGTPTGGGTSSFTATVTDGGSPAQTKSASLSIVVAPKTLAITSSVLTLGTSGTAYSQTLAASGGTTAYTWSVTSGSLPAGLSLAPSTGVISGTPTAIGTSIFTVTVTDSGSPVQTKSAATSIVIAPGLLAITTSALPAGTAGTSYSTTMAASGGTPAYTWSITSGSLPAGLTQAATTGVISGTPTVSGTFTFIAAVTDNSTPAQTTSMATSIVLAPATVAGSPTTWYIRQDGGTNTQCTGTTNASYPGTGTGQACAYNHPYQMLNWAGAWTAMVAGDTIRFADPATSPHTYYMGEQNQGVGMDWHLQDSLCPPPNAGHAAGSSCILPMIPNNVSILGQNAGSCHNSNHTGLVNPTILSGLNGVFTVIDLQASNHVTLSCLEITQADTCTKAGGGAGHCGDNSNYVGYAGIMFEYGIAQGPSNLTMQDIMVVGTAGAGILGSKVNTLSTDVTTGSDIYILGNGGSGWDADGGGCGTSCESVGTINLDHIDIEWNGCVAVMPYTTTVGGNGFNYCYGQNTGGYGDGFVQIAAGNMTLNVTHSTFKYNTQDGFDSLHLSDDPTTSPNINISDSWSEGNAGQSYKLGAGSTATAINNVAVGNCSIMGDPTAFAAYNNPAGWVSLDVGDTCRASGDMWAFQLNNGTRVTLENNTSMGYSPTMYDVGCAYYMPNCLTNGASFVFRNNLNLGFPAAANNGKLASGFYFGTGGCPGAAGTCLFANPGSAIDHNLWFNLNTGCPDNTVGLETAYVCGDPLLVSESDPNNLNPNLTSSSPAIGAGVTISGITTDYNGVTRPGAPSIGAYEH